MSGSGRTKRPAAKAASAAGGDDATPRKLPRTLKTSERIAREIVRHVAREKLTPGSPLPPEMTMVEIFGTGRASVREALRLLEAAGLIFLKPGRNGGPVVAQSGPEEMGRMLSLYLGLNGATYRDVAEFMITVSPRLAQLAAENPDRELVKRTLTLDHDNPCAPADVAPGEEATGPHALVNLLAGSSLLSLFADAADAIYASHVWSLTNGRGFRDTAREDHHAIARAVLEGDGPLARSLMSEHLERSFAYAQSAIPGLFDQPIEWK